MARDKGIGNADLDWDGEAETPNAPRSVFFDDIYFSGDGPAEAAHIFLNGNGLPARFQDAQRFSIGELGFGTGLNFLVAWQAWRAATKPASAQFHFLSVEAYPLSPDDMTRAHGGWPALSALSARLRDALPPPAPGFHRIEIEDGVTLTLFYGDVADGLSRAEADIDAWFLDGFAPSKNPAMWTPELFSGAARLSSPDATIATFTVAGAVRRAMKGAGFAVEKRAGFGRKREMLTGRLADRTAAAVRAPWFDTRKAARLGQGASVAIIGAGIAGASLAHALRRAGFQPVIYEAAAPAGGASGNPAGLIMPRLDAGDTPAGRFHAGAYLYAVNLLNSAQEQSGRQFFHACGVLHHALTAREQQRQEKLRGANILPPDWMQRHEDGLFFPQAGVVDPQAFVSALIGDTPVRKAMVARLEKEKDGWRAECADGAAERHDAVVIANGLEALRFRQTRSLPFAGSAGQVDYFPNLPAPDHAHAFGPYAAPAPPFSGKGGGLVIGATYSPIIAGEAPDTLAEATQSNINAVRRKLPGLVGEAMPDQSSPRASVRCTTPDRMAVAGPVPDWGFYGGAYDGLRHGRKQPYPAGAGLEGLFILSGLGSRGMVTAPLAAAMIVSEMAGAPAPVGAGVAEALHPARFFIRDLKRAKTVK